MLPKDWREFIELLNSNGVEHAIVGGFALAFHGRPRYTGDIDFLIHSTAGNPERLIRALQEFGFGSLGLPCADFLKPGCVVQLGQPPNRIDLITSLSGVETETVWRTLVQGELDGLAVQFIGRDERIKNKQATGRAQDRADVEALAADSD